MIKTCSVCKQDKPITEFGVLLRNKDGHAGRCKLCASAAVKASKHKHYVPHPRTRKPVEYYKAKQREYYLRDREKRITYVLQYQKDNKEKINKKNAIWCAANKNKVAQYFQNWKAANPGKALEQSREWKKANPHAVNAATALRRAQKKNATPVWANRFFMREAYHLAKLRTKMTGFKWEVDHIYPLQSDVVCGLHVENNLQVIPAVLNRQKGNKVIHHG